MSTELSSGQSFVALETAADVRARRDQVLSQYKAFKDALADRRAGLQSGLTYQKFLRNANELEKWIVDRMQLVIDENWKDTANLEIHIQKHSSLELEINANADTLSKLDAEGAELIGENSSYKEPVDTRLSELHHQWDELVKALQLRGLRLRQTKAWVSFYRKCDEVLYWINDKETVVNSTETGHDVDHVNMLQAKFDEFMSELQAYNDKIKDVNEDAERMTSEQDHPKTDDIKEKLTAVNEAWKKLNEKADQRKQMLFVATEIHRFNRDVAETISWIKEKESMVDSEDVGADVASVQTLQRTHEGAERDLAALKEKVTALCAEADRLEKEYNDESVAEQRKEVVDNWERLNKVAGARKERLQQSYELQTFLTECRELLRWADDIESRIVADELANDVAGAEMLVDKHQEHRGEIGAQEGSFTHANKFGDRLVSEGHPASSTVIVEVISAKSSGSSSSSSSSSSSDEEKESKPVKTKTSEGPGMIQETLTELNQRRAELLQIWDERNALYDQCLHLALFNRDAEQAESWMTTQEVLVEQDDLGDSLDAVQTLIRKHEDFGRSVVAQEEKIKSVGEVADRLIDRGHYAADDIGKRQKSLLERHQALKEHIERRRVALEDARKLRSYQRDARNLCSWIEERRKTARDECYKDPTNVRGKLQRHQVFEEEVLASEDLVQECLADAQRIIDAEHYASEEIQADADRVKSDWEKLLEECKERRNKLVEACAEQVFNRSVADLLRWIDTITAALASDDLGKDVDSVTTLIKKHQLLEVDVQVHKEKVDGMETQAKKFAEDNHFRSDFITEKSEDVATRYKALQEPMSERRAALAASLRSKQLIWDIQDEVEWIQDKRPIATATNIGKDLMSVRNLLKKHQIVQSEIAAHENQINDVQGQAKQLLDEEHFDSDDINASSKSLDDEWKKLRESADQREQDLKDALEAQKYLADANDAQIWIEAKQAIVSSSDDGVDEDSAESLLKKHESLQRDIDVYQSTITELRTEGENCKLQCPWAKTEDMQKVVAVREYKKKTARELTVKKGELLHLISNYNKNWWKVERDNEQGFVPATVLKLFTDDDLHDDSDDDEKGEDEVDGKSDVTLLSRQKQIENDYEELKLNAVTRRKALERSRRRHALARECDDMVRWIDEKRVLASTYQPIDGSDDGLEQVEKLQKKLDDFQKDLKARDKHLKELNKEAKSLKLYPKDARRSSSSSKSSSSSSSSSESDEDEERRSPEDVAVENKVQELNKQWGALHDFVKQQNDNLGSAHQVQKFFRDADETHEWIDEKSHGLDTENVGSDLPTVQALQRKHEGVERDLAALGERVHALDADASRLTEQHPEQGDDIQRKQTEINQAWNDLVAKSESRKRALSDSYDLQHFLADRRDLEHWLDHMQSQVGSDEVADDIAGAEALLQRHQDHRADMDARAPAFHALEREADTLVRAEHAAAGDVDAAVQETSRKREELEKAWANRHILLEQCLKLHLFLRDCENADNWMQAREAFLASEESGDSLDSVEALIKKHEDFDRAIGLQEAKISALQTSSERLIGSDPPHYASEQIKEKAKGVQDRWEKLKAALIDKRSRLGENRTLQQFSRDADEAEAWIADKLETATDDSYKDPSHIQSKHQKHQAFEAELEANKDRIRGIIDNGQQLIDTHQCAGSEDAVQSRIDKLGSDWENLLGKSSEKGDKLREANQQQNFITAAKDLDFWISEVEAVLASEDVGKDVPSVSNLVKKHKLLEADVAAHEDRCRELSKHASNLIDKADNSDALDRDAVEAKRDAVDKRFANVKEMTRTRKTKLQESLKIHQFFYDVADEESWIGEKKILVTSEDYGKDLTGVNKLMKKQKRIESEIASHEDNVERLLALGNELKEEIDWNKEDIDERVESLSNNWKSLKEFCEVREVRLRQAQTFQQFRADLEEESSWVQERLVVLDTQVPPDSLATAQSSLSKHETFETDLGVHRDRIAHVRTTGQSLIDEGNPHAESIAEELKLIGEKLEKLDVESTARRAVLRDTWAFLQFNWKVDIAELVIGEKQSSLKSDDYGDDLSAVKALIVKQETFEAGLAAFDQETITKITALKEQLVEASHMQSEAIIERHTLLMKSWDDLQAASSARRTALEKRQAHLRNIDDLCLLFAKKASAFNSWFENVEEDLTDPVRCHSIAEVEALIKEHEAFRETLVGAEKDLQELFDIDEKINELKAPVSDACASNNSYTWFKKTTLQESWDTVKKMVQTRDSDLRCEMERQQNNDEARKKFAQHANVFHDWLTSTRASMMEESGTLESQLESIKQISKEILEKKSQLQEIEAIGAALEEALILDNAYTEHSTVGLAQQWDQLEQLGMRMQHNLEQQIQARNMTGVTEEALKEFSMMFKHFDKDKTGKLEHHEFKSCLRSLGYDLPMVDEGEDDPEFQTILDAVDPNRDGVVSLQEYMGFMISRETENVKSSGEVESAFKALSAEGKPYVTKDELYQNLSREQADYCVAHMPSYYDSHGVHILGAFDYVAFTKQLFNN